MVTTRNNHDGQQANQEGNPSAILAEMRRELELMCKLREDDRLQREEERLRQAGANNALREENKRLRQRLERIEKAQHSRNVHTEGDRSQPAKQPQPTVKGTSPSENVRQKLLARTIRTRHRDMLKIRQITNFPSPMTYWQPSCHPTGIIPRWISTMALRTRTSTSTCMFPS